MKYLNGCVMRQYRACIVDFLGVGIMYVIRGYRCISFDTLVVLASSIVHLQMPKHTDVSPARSTWSCWGPSTHAAIKNSRQQYATLRLISSYSQLPLLAERYVPPFPVIHPQNWKYHHITDLSH